MAHLRYTVNCNHMVNSGEGFPAFVAFTKEADRLGYDYLRLLDHVVGFDSDLHPEIAKTPYTNKSAFQEVFTLMSYLSAVTSRIGFVTGVLGLPQRQTALVAKQAAQVDLMSGGRLILGVGIGYNSVEFQAMQASFADRAARIEEQIDLLRAFWALPAVSADGRWHRFTDVNVNPLPSRRSIPIWMGAGRQAQPVPPQKVLYRIGRMADGFMPLFRIHEATGELEPDAIAALDYIQRIRRDAGREDTPFDLEIGLYPHGKAESHVLDEIDYLGSIGVTHIHVRFPDEPLAAQLDFIRGFTSIRDTYEGKNG